MTEPKVDLLMIVQKENSYTYQSAKLTVGSTGNDKITVESLIDTNNYAVHWLGIAEAEDLALQIIGIAQHLRKQLYINS